MGRPSHTLQELNGVVQELMCDYLCGLPENGRRELCKGRGSLGVNGGCPHGSTGYLHACDEGWWDWEAWATQNPELICLSGDTVVPSRHLPPDEAASGPFHFLLTNACVPSALGSTRLWLSAQQEVLSLFPSLLRVPPSGHLGVGAD